MPTTIEWTDETWNPIRGCSGVPVFYKQGGSANRCSHDAKGGHFECFPEDLRVREFPQ